MDTQTHYQEVVGVILGLKYSPVAYGMNNDWYILENDQWKNRRNLVQKKREKNWNHCEENKVWNV